MCGSGLEREGPVGENGMGEEEGRTEKEKTKAKERQRQARGGAQSIRIATEKETAHSGFQNSVRLSSHMAVILACL